MGVVAGVVLNLALWQFTEISWLWWNLTGFAATVFVTAVLSGWDKGPLKEVSSGSAEASRINWPRVYVWIAIYFFLIVGLCRVIEATTY